MIRRRIRRRGCRQSGVDVTYMVVQEEFVAIGEFKLDADGVTEGGGDWRSGQGERGVPWTSARCTRRENHRRTRFQRVEPSSRGDLTGASFPWRKRLHSIQIWTMNFSSVWAKSGNASKDSEAPYMNRALDPGWFINIHAGGHYHGVMCVG